MDDRKDKLSNKNQVKFEDVLKHERAAIAEKREPSEDPAKVKHFSALAFSGGGIRSAVFNLGFIQGLANLNTMHAFDYLSTVSGGGYSGGWLSALLKRETSSRQAGEADMQALQEKFLKPLPKQDASVQDSFPEAESKPIRFLRRYSNYLNPRLGLSGDTLALISLMVRNVLVMQLLLVSMLVTVFAGLLLTVQIRQVVSDSVWSVVIIGVAIDLVAIALISALLLQGKTRLESNRPTSSVTYWVLVPALLSGELAAIGLNKLAPVDWSIYGAIAAAVVYVAAWLYEVCLKPQPQERAGEKHKNVSAWVGILGGAATLGILLYQVLSHSLFREAIAFAPLAAMLIFSLSITVHLALAGTAVSEQSREWWARLGGQGIFLAVGWTVVFAFLLYVPPLMLYGWDKATHWLIAGGGLWTALTWMGAQFAHSKDTGTNGSSPVKEILAKVGPWVFLVGLLGLVAWGTVWLLFDIKLKGDSLQQAISAYLAVLNSIGIAKPLFITTLAGLLFWMLLKFVDLNLFSAHSFYVNRLARTFMGASQHKRIPDAYTGFDPKDDLAIAELAGQRPIHIINTTLNLTGGEDLAWQTRRGASFTFTPCYTGYTARDSKGDEFGCFRPTAQYGGNGGLSLATAVAVSGAAASPNMGFHTSTSVAALLTAFNLRLARWCPNPLKDDEWRRTAPRNSAMPLFSELFGDTDGKHSWINLSDGGHFENFGIYELIRRRVSFILVTDAASDENYQFDDLAMAVRKIWVDFGVRVEIAEQDLEAIRPKAEKDAPRFSSKNWVFGRICYPGNEPPGYLIYVKSSITKDIPIDIRQYRDAHPAFPQESTADQWFDEDQFESYRHLGQFIAERLLREMSIDGADMNASEIIAKLYEKANEYFNRSAPCQNTAQK